MAKYKITGAIHAETIKSICEINGKEYFIKTISITDLKKSNFEKDLNSKDLEGMIIADPETIRVLRERLEECNWDIKKAFEEPIYKPSRNSERKNRIKRIKVVDGPAVTYVTLKRGKGKGYADNRSMVRVDIFRKNGKYYSVPVYASWIERYDLPIQYTPLKNKKHVDDTLEFCFSLYPRELVYLSDGEYSEYVYYVSMNSSTAGDYVFVTDDLGRYTKNKFLNNDIRRVGYILKSITTLNYLKKKYVDVLGFIHDIKKSSVSHYFSDYGKLNIKDKRLVYTKDDKEIIDIPIDDISAIVIESRQMILTSYPISIVLVMIF